VPASIPEPIELTTQVSGFNQLNHISISETERLRSSGRSVLRLGMTPDNEGIGRASGGQGQRHVGEFAFDRMFSHRSLLGPVALRELLRAPAVAGRQAGRRSLRPRRHTGRAGREKILKAAIAVQIVRISGSPLSCLFFALLLHYRGKSYTVAPATLTVEGSPMSGHSKWATIKHKKAATDARRGKIFTKLIRELTIAARVGGSDPDTNPRLRTAILAAKSENMPNDNIERAVQRGTGQLEGETLDEVTFEGYGPGGVGVLVAVVTSNRNRIVSEIRHMFSKNGGNLAETGAVGWMFHRKGDIVVPKEQADEEKMMSIVLDAGAEDLRDDGSAWEVTTPPEAMEKVRDALASAGITPSSSEVAWVPQNYVKLSGQQAQQMLRMVETLEDHDDVQRVYANFDIDEKEIQAAVAS
jgi:YebC/PmpR family DNA-binding regulatory protein